MCPSEVQCFQRNKTTWVVQVYGGSLSIMATGPTEDEARAKANLWWQTHIQTRKGVAAGLTRLALACEQLCAVLASLSTDCE